MTVPTTDLLTLEQAAAELNMSLADLDRHNRAGCVPYRRIGGQDIRVLRSDVDSLKAAIAHQASIEGPDGRLKAQIIEIEA